MPSLKSREDLTLWPLFSIMEFMIHPTWIIAALCLLSSISFAGSADDSVGEKHRFLISGMRAEREKLRSGRVEMLGEYSKPSKDFPEFRVPVRFLYLFDHDQSRFRHETRDFRPKIIKPIRSKRLDDATENSELPRGVTAAGEKWVSVEIGGTIVHTPEFSLFRSCGTSVIDQLPPGTVGHTAVLEMDIRTFGLTDLLMFQTGTPLARCLNALESKYPEPAIENEANGISRFRFNFHGEVLWEIWVDEIHGMTPIRSVRTELKEGKRESSRSEVTWQRIHDVWVPSTFSIRMSSRSTMDRELSLIMNWESVNQPLEAKLFTARGLAEADQTIQVVADTSLGQVVIEPAIQLPMPSVTISASMKPVKPDSSSRFWWIILANVIGVGVAWWFIRRWARRQDT